MLTAAHPDDIATTAGGTVAELTRQGTRVVYVITTNGDKGFHKVGQQLLLLVLLFGRLTCCCAV